MKVLFVASELTPIAKVGGLGDVIGSLPKALERLGLDVSIIIPRYEVIDKKRWGLKEIPNSQFLISNENPNFKNEKCKLYLSKLPQSNINIFFVENEKYLSCGPIYFEKTAFVGSQKEIDRFVFFSHAVFELLQTKKLSFEPDIVHCHDWHSAALIKMLRDQPFDTAQSKKLKTIFTIHNLANQGIYNGINLIAEGIKNSDLVTTVSPTYAKEIQTKEYGEGLEKLLQKRAKEKKLMGILNAIDYNFWYFLPHHHVHHQYNPPPHPRFGFVARLTEQKGLSLLLPLISYFVKKYDAEFYFLGQGSKKFEENLQELMHGHHGRIFVKIGFDEILAHHIYANTDFFLMPSLFEPCGLGQMISMHYGNIPIVRATGGLKDTVRHLRTGIVFEKPTTTSLKKSMKLAIEIFKNQSRYHEIKRNCLKKDFSWDESAKKYKQIYKKLLTTKF